MNEAGSSKEVYRKLLLEERKLKLEQKWITRQAHELQRMLLTLQIEALHLQNLSNPPEKKSDATSKEEPVAAESEVVDTASVINAREVDLRILKDLDYIMKGTYAMDDSEEEDEDCEDAEDYREEKTILEIEYDREN